MTKTKLTEKEKEAYAIVGRLGGRATAKKLGKKGMSALGKKGAKARWKLKAKKK
jgi:general stress protein YciG